MNYLVSKGILLAVFCSFICLLLHIIVSFFRLGRRKDEPLIFELNRQTKLLLFIWLVTFSIYVLLFFFPIQAMNIVINVSEKVITGISFIYGIIFYTILSFMYLTVYYFVDRSVSATLLEIIENSAGKKLTQNEIKNIYSLENKYQTELTGMLEGRFIIKDGDCYRNSFKGSLYAKIARLMKGILKLGLGG